jgi:leader peptidase (prepilin peptidase)/N-methyltransferase
VNVAATIMAFGAGLCVGSFANVLVHRLPRGLQVVRGRSSCPHCGALIRWFDNLPLVSWLALRARCRDCRGRISWRYPALELAVGLIASGCVASLGPTPAALRVFLFLTILLVVAVIDAEHFVIPHSLTVSGLAGGLGLAAWGGPGWWQAALGAALGAGIIVVSDRTYRLLRARPGMGGGDVMMLAMIGAFLGPWGVAATLGFAAALGLVFTLVRSRGRLDRRQRLPFGPFLAAGAVIVLLWGEGIWSWYLGLVGAS